MPKTATKTKKTKKTVKKAKAKATKTAKPKKEINEKYIECIGRRKTSTARVRIYPDSKKKDFIVNEKSLENYFPLKRQVKTVLDPFEIFDDSFKVTVKVMGGGINSQSEAIRLGLSRTLVELDENSRSKLKARGYLTRDSRMVERKKPGLRKARRPQ
ncbi:MAG: 30S ribosomal protein S9, partial [Candidatus Paceibacterota bacterium]